MTTLHFGVTDIPYSFSENIGTTKSGKARLSTTGDVAEILEDKYHVMEHFFEAKQDRIVELIQDAIVGAFESVVSGSPPPNDPHGAATIEIEAMFSDFLTRREMDGLGYPGIPTQAALAGVNHRLKHPYSKKNPPRPSFVDTGLYENSFRAWVD